MGEFRWITMTTLKLSCKSEITSYFKTLEIALKKNNPERSYIRRKVWATRCHLSNEKRQEDCDSSLFRRTRSRTGRKRLWSRPGPTLSSEVRMTYCLTWPMAISPAQMWVFSLMMVTGSQRQVGVPETHPTKEHNHQIHTMLSLWLKTLERCDFLSISQQAEATRSSKTQGP